MSTDETIDVDGPRAAAEILSRLPRETQSRLVASIRTLNPQSALKIESIIVQTLAGATQRTDSRTKAVPATTRSAPTTPPSKDLRSLSEIPDAKLQEVLRQVSPRELAVSLQHAPRQTQEKVLSNISSTKQQEVLDELTSLPPIRPSDAEAAQARLLKSVDDVYAEDTPSDAPPVRRLRSRLA